jgi:hypothetical protein
MTKKYSYTLFVVLFTSVIFGACGGPEVRFIETHYGDDKSVSK